MIKLNINIILSLSLLIAFLTPVQAAQSIYKRVLPNGQISYSNQPGPGAQEVKIIENKPETPSTSSTENNQETPSFTPDPTPEAAINYQIKFILPQNEQVYTVGQPDIKVDLSLTPELSKTDRIRLFIDDKPYGDLQSGLQYTLSDLERGTHILQAKIYAEDGLGEAKAKTGPLAIHVQKPFIKTHPSAGIPMAPQAPQAPQAPKGP